MKNDNNIPVDTKNIIQTPLNVATTDATGVTTAGTNTASTTAATTTTTIPVGNGADETTRCSLFSAGRSRVKRDSSAMVVSWDSIFVQYRLTNGANI
ncbi:hypothetical protein DY000_02022850 [Brassica cretica]|uniref:Uncharacterized protein n=1 Tax=Brassica cretica TaxID=69181 RepID=A0ABQ7E5G7_BRACR|nr:hypothetical protein DY000_02022850 [Brassica cretica]